MSRTYLNKKITNISKNKHGEWEVQLEDGTTIHFYSDGVGNPTTDCYLSTGKDREAKRLKEEKESA